MENNPQDNPAEQNEGAAQADSAADLPSLTSSWSWMTATILSIVLGLLVAVLMTFAMFWIGDYYRGSEASLHEQRKQKLREITATAQKELTTYTWVNQDDKTVRVPIDRAMQLLVDEGGFTPPPPPEDKPKEDKPEEDKDKKPADDKPKEEAAKDKPSQETSTDEDASSGKEEPENDSDGATQEDDPAGAEGE